MAFTAHLKPERITKLRDAFTSAQLPYNEDMRTLLMAGISPQYVQNLREYETNASQLAGDLGTLNTTQLLTDGTVPLNLWLQNAKEHFSPRMEALIFEQALQEMSQPVADRPDTAEVIVQGLEALWALIEKNKVAFETIIIYRDTFGNALHEIDVIADYKLMHDALHQLQLSWPEDVFLSPTHQPQSPMMQILIRKYLTLLQNTAQASGKILEKGNVEAKEVEWIDKFNAMHQELNHALSATDKDKIIEGFDNVKSELTLQLSQLNTRLKDAISDLHLKSLIRAMNNVCKELRDIDSKRTAKLVEKYEAGIQKLTELEVTLSRLIDQHDKWQHADTMLRMLGKMIVRTGEGQESRSSRQEESRVDNLKLISNTIETEIEPLHKGKETDWSKGLSDSAMNLKLSVEKKDTDTAVQWFDIFRENAWYFFFELDTEMKNQCEELRKIGDKLRQVDDELKNM